MAGQLMGFALGVLAYCRLPTAVVCGFASCACMRVRCQRSCNACPLCSVRTALHWGPQECTRDAGCRALQPLVRMYRCSVASTVLC
jgi:hypothetical protein